ncbi:MAG: hypothetical protein ACP5IZ_10820 [Thermoprotei archaeon]
MIIRVLDNGSTTIKYYRSEKEHAKHLLDSIFLYKSKSNNIFPPYFVRGPEIQEEVAKIVEEFLKNNNYYYKYAIIKVHTRIVHVYTAMQLKLDGE